MSGRGSKPGERRGGRKPGTPNRRTQELLDRLEALDCDPIDGLAQIAMDPTSSPELRVRCYAELAQYAYPKRKAVEISAAPLSEFDGVPTETLVRQLQDLLRPVIDVTPPPGLPEVEEQRQPVETAS